MSILIPRKNTSTSKSYGHQEVDSSVIDITPVRDLSIYCSTPSIFTFNNYGTQSLSSDGPGLEKGALAGGNIAFNLNTNIADGGYEVRSNAPGRSNFNAYQSFTSALMIVRARKLANGPDSVANGAFGAFDSGLKTPVGFYFLPENWGGGISVKISDGTSHQSVAFGAELGDWINVVIQIIGTDRAFCAVNGEFYEFNPLASGLYWLDAHFKLGRCRTSTNEYFRGETELAAFLPEVEATEELAIALSENPYKILKPRRKYWVLPTAAGTVTLGPILATEASSGPSAAKVDNLTQSTETTALGVISHASTVALGQVSEVTSLNSNTSSKSDTLTTSTEVTNLNPTTSSKSDSLTTVAEATTLGPILDVSAVQLGLVTETDSLNSTTSSKSNSLTTISAVTGLNSTTSSKSDSLANTSEVTSLNSTTSSKSDSLTTISAVTALNQATSSKSDSLANISEVTNLLNASDFKEQLLSKTLETALLNAVTDADTVLLGKCATSGTVSSLSPSKLSNLTTSIENTLLTNLSRLYTLIGVTSTESLSSPLTDKLDNLSALQEIVSIANQGSSKVEVLSPTSEISSLLNIIISGSNTLGTISSLENTSNLSYSKLNTLGNTSEVSTINAVSNFKVTETTNLANLTSYKVYQLGNSTVELVTLGSVTKAVEGSTDQYIIIDGEVIIERNVTKYVTNNTPKTRVIVQGGGNRVITQPASSNVIITDNSTKIGVNSGYNLSTTIGGEDAIMYRKIVDFVEGTDYMYIGEADPGTVESASSWRIKRITIDDITDDIAESWAAGNANFDKVWTNRASETYL